MTQNYKCPYTGFKKRCVDLRDTCPKWVHMYGRDGNHDEVVDVWDCADRWVPVLLSEATAATRGVTATLDEFRNEVEERQAMLDQAASDAARITNHRSMGADRDRSRGMPVRG